MCDYASIPQPLNPVLSDWLCFPARAALSCQCNLAGLQSQAPLGFPRDPYQPLPGAALHFAQCKFFLMAHFVLSLVQTIRSEMSLGSDLQAYSNSYIVSKTSYWVLGAQMLLWIWAVSTSDLNRTEPIKCSDVQHHCKNEMAVGEVVSNWDFSLKIKLKEISDLLQVPALCTLYMKAQHEIWKLQCAPPGATKVTVRWNVVKTVNLTTFSSGS